MLVEIAGPEAFAHAAGQRSVAQQPHRRRASCVRHRGWPARPQESTGNRRQNHRFSGEVHATFAASAAAAAAARPRRTLWGRQEQRRGERPGNQLIDADNPPRVKAPLRKFDASSTQRTSYPALCWALALGAPGARLQRTLPPQRDATAQRSNRFSGLHPPAAAAAPRRRAVPRAARPQTPPNGKAGGRTCNTQVQGTVRCSQQPSRAWECSTQLQEPAAEQRNTTRWAVLEARSHSRGPAHTVGPARVDLPRPGDTFLPSFTIRPVALWRRIP